jgi:Na+/proline symporter
VVHLRRASWEGRADYLLAGRRLGYGLSLFTIFATWFGAETCIGAAGAFYENGLSRGSADPFGYTTCLLLMGLVLAAPLWRRGLTTLADLFRERYGAGVERLAVLLMVPTSLLWAGAQVRAFGQVLASSSELAIAEATALAAAAVVLYTVRGGMWADALTDLVQGIALIAGLVVLLVAVLAASGGPGAAFADLPPERLRPFAAADGSWLDVAEAWSIPILGSLVAQELIARVLAARSVHVARRSTLGASALYLAVGLVPAALGLAGAKLLPGLDEPEQLLPRLAALHLGTLGYVVFAGAIVSAILSTADSALLVSASLVSHNVIVPLRPGMTEAQKVRTARWFVAIFGLLAWLFAVSADGVRDLVEQASGFGSAGLLWALVFGLFTRFGGAAAAGAGLAAGVGVWTLGAYVAGWPWPHLSSLAAAPAAYVTVGAIEHALGRARPSASP